LKAAYSSHFSVPAEKIKILDMKTKRPVADSKLVSDIVEDGAKDVEFGVMLLGVTPTTPSATPAAVAADTLPKEDVEMKDADKPDVLSTKEFWSDLEIWLGRKVGSEEGKRLAGVFKKAAGR
jgi:Blt1 N-terminal domain/Get5 carboxyl domain